MTLLNGGSWYNGATLLIALAALIVGGIAAYYGRRAIFPSKRRLTLSSAPSASLLAGDAASTAGLEVRHDGRSIGEPYLATLYIENSGRHAIASEQFDANRPIVIDLGVPVTAVSKVSVLPGVQAGYVHSVSDSRISLGPDLLNPGQSLIVQLITEGKPKIDSLRERVKHHLRDTDVEYKDQPAGSRSQAQRVRGAFAVTLVASVIAALVLIISLFFLQSSGLSVSLLPDNGAPGSEVSLLGQGVEKFATVYAEIPGGTGGASRRTVSSTTPSSTAGQPSVPSSSSSATSDTVPADSELGRGQADKDGNFEIKLKLPDDLSSGSIQITVVARESSGYRYEYVQYYVH